MVVAGLYLFAAGMSLMITVPGATPGGLWLCSGLAISALLVGGLRLWPAVFIGALGVHFLRFGIPAAGALPWGSAFAIALGKALEAFTAAWLLRRAGPRPLETLLGVFRFLAINLVASAIGAAFGPAALLQTGLLPLPLLPTAAWTWWLGHVASAALLVPLCLAWAEPLTRDSPASVDAPHRPRPTILGAAAFAALCAAILLMPAAGTASRLAVFLVFPGIALAAHFHGARGAATATLIVAVCAVAGAMRGCGPFSAGSPIDLVVGVDSCIVFCAAIGMALAADRVERAQSQVARSVQRDVMPWVALMAAVALTVGAWTLMARDAEHESLGRFAQRASQLRWRLQARMQEYERILHGGVALLTAAPCGSGRVARFCRQPGSADAAAGRAGDRLCRPRSGAGTRCLRAPRARGGLPRFRGLPRRPAARIHDRALHRALRRAQPARLRL